MTRTPGSENSELTRTDLPDRFLTASNLLSLIRLILSVPFVIVMTSDLPHKRYWGGAIMVIAALTDKLDGYAARRLGQTSDWGKILDPLADKVAVATVLVVLFFLGDLPAWFLLVGVGRDLIILVGGLYLKRKTGVLVPSNELGKWTVGVIALLLFTLVLGIGGFPIDFLFFLSTAMMILSLIQYSVRFRNILRERG